MVSCTELEIGLVSVMVFLIVDSGTAGLNENKMGICPTDLVVRETKACLMEVQCGKALGLKHNGHSQPFTSSIVLIHLSNTLYDIWIKNLLKLFFLNWSS